MESNNIYMSLLTVQLREHMQYPHTYWRKINLGSNRIPAGWVQHDQDVGIEIRIELPTNWYQNDHFLGFGFFCVHQPGFKSINIDLVFDEQYSYCPYCGVHVSKSDEELMLLYFPKIAIWDKHRSNQYVLFHANGKFRSYGIHLIYSEDHQRNRNSSLEFLNTQDDEDNCMPMLPNFW